MQRLRQGLVADGEGVDQAVLLYGGVHCQHLLIVIPADAGIQSVPVASGSRPSPG
ncbi:hypothetical protein [Candidatus Thiodiazotropha sp. CDECU1]|uniref:hypothetical protein n=1 Tax=Candidatus Thiodiazotropha sp. CDECU1 TaxID=3065865 RepID=UPI0029311175|nr:hypothetical protein [Candidatus Thiodiazotropha sp. CDECU1]